MVNIHQKRERDQQKDSLSTTFFFFSLPPQWHRSLAFAGGRGCLWLRGQNFARWHRWEWSGTAGWGMGDTRSPGHRNSSGQYTHGPLYDTPKPHQPMNEQTNQSASLLQCCKPVNLSNSLQERTHQMHGLMETLQGRKIKGFWKCFRVAFKLNQTITQKKKRKKKDSENVSG